MTEAAEIVSFWRDAGPERWFAKNDDFDAEFRNRFLDEHFAAARLERQEWSSSPEGSLALMVLLDQLPRNCFRGTAHMFATDPLAHLYASHAIEAGQHHEVERALSLFFFLPFMHAEAIADQHRSVSLCSDLDLNTQKFAEEHKDIILRFGRFPHRNAVLGRETTAAEHAFLVAGGFSG